MLGTLEVSQEELFWDFYHQIQFFCYRVALSVKNAEGLLRMWHEVTESMQNRVTRTQASNPHFTSQFLCDLGQVT